MNEEAAFNSANQSGEEEKPAISNALIALGIAIAGKRREAVLARLESGIESIWDSCEEAYLGIDDSNRHQYKGRFTKAVSGSGPVSKYPGEEGENRSTAYVRLTTRYVDFAATKLSEIALPIDDKAFSLDATPVPDVDPTQGATPTAQPAMPGGIGGLLGGGQMGAPAMAPGPAAAGGPAFPGAAPQGVPPAVSGEQAPVPAAVGAAIGGSQDPLQAQENANHEAAKKAENRIWDWMVEGGYTREMRRVFHDSARIGVGVLKGPIPDIKKARKLTTDGQIAKLEIVEKVVPVTRRVDPRNLFPAPGCGEDIHDGEFVFEREFVSRKTLLNLKKRKGWNADAIEQVLKEGPGKVNSDAATSDNDEQRTRHQFERWTYYGLLTLEELLAAGVKVPKDEETGDYTMQDAHAIVTLINDTVVKAVLHPLDSGNFPFRVFPWTVRDGHWAGVGVAEQMEMPQRMVNAGTRAMLNNAGKSSGVQIVLDRGSIVPQNGKWEIVPDKVWLKAADAIIDDVRKAFFMFEYPNIQQQLMPIIEYGLRLAEEHTSVPLVSQGFYAQGGSPQTFGQAELQNNNANAMLREKGRMVDEYITEGLVADFYEWLLVDPDVPDDEKGDFSINAKGTSAMVERAIQEFTLIQMLQLSANPAFGADPKKTYAMLLRSKHIDPSDIQYSEQEMQQMASQTPPPPPQVLAAQINAKAKVDAANISAQADLHKSAMDTDRDTVYINAQRERDAQNAQSNREELQLKYQLAILDYANKRNISINEIRAELANNAMKLKTEKELAAMATAASLHKHHNPAMEPAVEVPGRAANGHALDQMPADALSGEQ